MTRCQIFFVTGCFLFLAPLHAASNLRLSDYLEQVKHQHKGIRAAEMNRDNAGMARDEVAAPLTWQVFANAQHQVDKKESATPINQPGEVDSDLLAIGVSKQTSTGLQAKLSYQVLSSSAKDTKSSNPVTGQSQGQDVKAIETRPMLELTQSLWRNGFGSETRALMDAADAKARASGFQEDYKISLVLYEAERSYWRLSLARRIVAAQRESLQRAKKLFDLNQRRVKMLLADKGDQLQAEANLRYREYDASSGQQELHSAGAQFNKLRGQDSGQIPESLADPEATIAAVKLAKSDFVRADLQAQIAFVEAAKRQAQLASEKYSPTLDLFANWALNGREDKFSPANDESFSAKKPTTVIGLKFSSSLEFGLIRRLKGEANVQAMAAEQDLEQRRFELKREWFELLAKIDDAQSKLQLAKRFEEVQRQKILWERQRQNLGRSTTFQVLSFENDYATAQLQRFQTEAELMQLIASARLFGAST